MLLLNYAKPWPDNPFPDEPGPDTDTCTVDCPPWMCTRAAGHDPARHVAGTMSGAIAAEWSTA